MIFLFKVTLLYDFNISNFILIQIWLFERNLDLIATLSFFFLRIIIYIL